MLLTHFHNVLNCWHRRRTHISSIFTRFGHWFAVCAASQHFCSFTISSRTSF